MSRIAPFRSSAPTRKLSTPPVIVISGPLDAATRARLTKLGAHRVFDASEPELMVKHLLVAFADCRRPCCATPTDTELWLERAMYGSEGKQR